MFPTTDDSQLSVRIPKDELKRNVYCVLGLPIDATDIATVLREIEAATARRTKFLISTPNLNFLVQARSDSEFRETLLNSDLCPADGMPIVWIARLYGVPIKQRVSGSDIFEALKSSNQGKQPIKLFLFGGAEGIAAKAASALNEETTGVRCVGTISPGFGSVEEMSRDQILDEINASGADFVVVSLGAKKGQLWLYRNRQRLTIPIRAHFGAAVNFEAGSVERAPLTLRNLGLEWLWRIKEEPHLWRRYAHDGYVLGWLLFTRILPLAVVSLWYRFKTLKRPHELQITISQNQSSATIWLGGDATYCYVDKAIEAFQEPLAKEVKSVVINLAGTRLIDVRFFGFLLMLRKYLKERGATLTFVQVAPPIQRMFRLNDLGFLLG